jgi:hypothetical protein
MSSLMTNNQLKARDQTDLELNNNPLDQSMSKIDNFDDQLNTVDDDKRNSHQKSITSAKSINNFKKGKK